MAQGPDVCEVCDEQLLEGALYCGCEKCGRMYGPCCNSIEDGVCIQCTG